MKEPNRDLLDAYYKEYATVRQEILTGFGNRTQILSFGLATIGVLVFATASSHPVYVLERLMFDVAIPLVSLLVYLIWFGEVERQMRAGKYLRNIEKKVNAELGLSEVLRYETLVNKELLIYPYVFVTCLFVGTGSMSPFLGIFLSPNEPLHLGREIFGSSASSALTTPLIAWCSTFLVVIYCLWRYVTHFRRHVS